MPNIGPMELLVVLIIALVVLGPKRLPAAGRSLGRGINEFKAGISGRGDRPAIPAQPSATPRPETDGSTVAPEAHQGVEAQT